MLDELLKGCKRPDDLLREAGLMKELKIRLMERMLGAPTPADLPLKDCLSVRLPNGGLFRWSLQRGGETVQLEAQGRPTLDEVAIAGTAVLDGVGIRFFIEQDVTADIAVGRLVRLLNDWTPPRLGFSLYYPGRRNPWAGFTAFLAVVKKAAAQDETVGG